jgi:hypothetical protein
MTISDLPQFTIKHVETLDGDMRLTGTFNHLAGVRADRSWLLAPNDQLIGDLENLDPEHNSAVFATFAEYEPIATIGARLAWLDAYWQARLIVNVSDPHHRWWRINFAARDATITTEGDVQVRQPVQNAPGEPSGGASAGTGRIRIYDEDQAAVAGTVAGGWDHEHCEICWDHIDADHPMGYVDDAGDWLCAMCHQKWAVRRDIGFVLP